MIRSNAIIIFILFLSTGRQLLSGQSIDILPQFLSTKDGLSQGLVQSIMQDSKGFLWFGTRDGLNRYDGYTFRVFRHNPFDSLSINDNRIRSMLEDPYGRIWVVTESGLNLFDPKREVFYTLPIPHLVDKEGGSKLEHLVTGELSDGITITTLGNICYQLKLPPYSYDLSQLRITAYDESKSTSAGLCDIAIELKIIPINDSRYLINTYDGLKVLDYKLDQKESNFTNDLSFLPEGVLRILEQKDVKYIFKGANGNVWICDAGGATIFNIADRVVKSYPLPELSQMWQKGTITSMSEGKERVAFGGEFGLVVLNKSSGRVDFSVDIGDPIFKYGQGPLCIDEGGIIWVGTKGIGAIKYDLNSARFSVSKSPTDQVLCWKESSVRSILETRNGDILIGTMEELKWYSAQTENTVSLLLPNSIVSSMVEDRKGRVWGTSQKLFRLEWDNAHGWQLSGEYPIPKGDYPHGAKLLISTTGSLWLVNQRNLCRFNETSGEFTCFELPLQVETSVTFYEYPTLVEDSLGYLWVGSTAGLMRFDTFSRSFTNYTNDPSNRNSLGHRVVRSILPDPLQPRKYLWVGTAGGGLDKLDMDKDIFHHFGQAEGLPDLVIYGLLPDRNGNIWMSTNRGVAVMDVVSEKFRCFDIRDGLQDNEFNSAAYSITTDGAMFFGGVSGLNRFRPEAVLIKNNRVPKVAITSFRVSNREVPLRQNIFGFDENPAYADELRIPQTIKSFSLEFAALDFAEPDKNQFAYKLVDFDAEWQYSGNRHTATYTNLDPGTYTFHVKAANNDGVWNDQGVSLKIIIVPPWYRTWWAYILYGIGIWGILYFFRSKELLEQNLKHELDIKQIEAQKLKEVDSLKSDFFANISHEFRTPLTLIQGYIDQLELQISDDVLLQPVQEVSRNSRKLLQLINEILDLSKIDAGRMKLELKEQDLISFLRNLVLVFQPVAQRRSIDLDMASDVESISFAFDQLNLERVFMNLLSNALKFTQDGGSVAVSVKAFSSVEKPEEDPKSVMVQIKDNGTGIDSKSIRHIFDRFYQGDSPGNRKGGTGIGLALVKELVQLHGGDVSVESAPGEGTIFTVMLPVVHIDQVTEMAISSIPVTTHYDVDQDLPESDMESDYGVTNGSPESKVQILLVEDNPAIRKLIRGQLQTSGYNLMEAEDGEQGFQLAMQSVPDLIISDVMMPVMDGFAFCQAIREQESTSHIPVIMLTARVEDEDRLRGLQIGVDDYLTKPFNAKELKARIENLLRQRKLLRERFRTMTVIQPAEVSAVPADQAFMEKIVAAIEDNMDNEQFGVEALGEAVHLSPNQLHRKLTALIHQSPGQLIRTMRLQRAADLLVHRTGTISEIAYQVGFSVPENFTRSFRKQFGLSPTEYMAAQDRPTP